MLTLGGKPEAIHSDESAQIKCSHPGAFDAQRTLFRFSSLLGIFLPGQISHAPDVLAPSLERSA